MRAIFCLLGGVLLEDVGAVFHAPDTVREVLGVAPGCHIVAAIPAKRKTLNVREAGIRFATPSVVGLPDKVYRSTRLAGPEGEHRGGVNDGRVP